MKTSTDHNTFALLNGHNFKNAIFKATGPLVITFTKTSGSDVIENDAISSLFRLVQLS